MAETTHQWTRLDASVGLNEVTYFPIPLAVRLRHDISKYHRSTVLDGITTSLMGSL